MEIYWQQCYGGSNGDLVRDIAVIESGYFITGGTSSNDGDISYYHGEGDGWLIRVDSLGNILWEKTYGGSDLEYFARIIPATDGNYYLLGLSYSSDGDISYDLYPGSPDYWIVKIDSSGNILWDKIAGGNQGEVLFTGDATLDGGVVAVGWTYSNDGDVSLNYGGADTWAVKISSDGELEWDYTIGTDWIDKGQAILATSDGGYLIASSSAIHENAIGNITCTPHTYAWAEGVLFKLDSNLNIEWQHCYGGSDHDGITALLEVNDGYVFGAYVNSNDGDIFGWHGENDIWIVKVDLDGNIIWQNPIGGSRSEFLTNLLKTEDDGIIVPGYTHSNNGDVSGNHSLSEYESDIWFVKLNSEGELLTQQCFGGIGSEIVEFGVVKKSDNNFVIAGTTNYGPSYDVGCAPHGSLGIDTDYWVFEIDSLDTTGAIENHYENVIKVYPNPAKEFVVFELTPPYPSRQSGTGSQGGNCSEIVITDVFGQEMGRKALSPITTTIDVSQLPNGLYFYRVEKRDIRYQGKLIIQR